MKPKLSISKALVAVLFFLSGFSGLIYQVLWVRQFKLLLGSSIVSVSIILSVFMGGLLLGAWWIGKKINLNKVKNELNWYGGLELFIGFYGLLLVFLIPYSTSLFSVFNEPQATFSYLSIILNIIGTCILILLPTVAMGATLPLLVNYFTKKEFFRSVISLFYSINAIGGAIASLIAGFVLIKNYGVNGAIYFAVALNILVGLIALFWSRKINRVQEFKSKVESVEQSKQKSSKAISNILLTASFLTGFLSLAYEILWVRCLNYLVNNSTYTFSIILFVFLLGIGLGSFIISTIKFIKHKKVLLGIIQMLIAICGLLIVNLFYSFAYTDQFAEWFLETNQDMSSWQKNTGLNLTFSILVFLFPALLMGMSFPILSDIYFQVKKIKSGVAISKIYVLNTFGSILGALIPIFVLIPILGSIKNVLYLLAIINLLIGLYFLFKSEYKRRKLIGTILLIGFLVSFKIIPSDAVLASLEVGSDDSKGVNPIFYKEGVMATVKVYDKDNRFRSLSIDGVTIASEAFFLKEKMIGHLPFFTNRKIDKVLAVGLASGSTVKAILKHEEISSLDVVEIVPGVMNTLKYFNEDNSDLRRDKRINIYIDDVVSFLTYSDKKYDMISSDGKFGFLNKANTTMLSKEYYELCKKKLNDNGVFAQWVSTKIPNKHLETILTTIKSVFPYSELFLVRKNLFILSSKQPIALLKSKINAALSNSTINQDLIKSNFYTAEELLSTYVGPNYFSTIEINTVNKPILEYDFNKERDNDLNEYRTVSFKNLSKFKQSYIQNEDKIKSGVNTITRNPEISYEMNMDYINSRINYYNANFSLLDNNLTEAIDYFNEVVEINHPSNNNDIAVSAKYIGEQFLNKNKFKGAIKYFNIAIDKLPGYSDVYTLRGVSYLYSKDTTASKIDFKKALELNPNDINALELLKQLK